MMNEFLLDIDYISHSHENVLEQCDKMVCEYETNPNTLLIIDFGACDFLYPDYALILLCAIKYIESKGTKVNGKIRLNKNKSIYEFLLKMEFFKNLKIEIPEPESSFEENSFLEIQTYNSKNQIIVINRIVKMLRQKSNMDDNVFTSLDYCLSEILDNILNHSKEKEGWVVAQYYSRLNQIRLMVVDHGIGIHKALNEKHNYSEQEALEKCIISGVTNGKGQGHGLYATSLFIKENKGWLSIMSGNYKLDVNENETSLVEIKHWQGTCVYLRINTNIEVDYKLFTSNMFDQKEHLFEQLFQ